MVWWSGGLRLCSSDVAVLMAVCCVLCVQLGCKTREFGALSREAEGMRERMRERLTEGMRETAGEGNACTREATHTVDKSTQAPRR